MPDRSTAQTLTQSDAERYKLAMDHFYACPCRTCVWFWSLVPREDDGYDH